MSTITAVWWWTRRKRKFSISTTAVTSESYPTLVIACPSLHMYIKIFGSLNQPNILFQKRGKVSHYSATPAPPVGMRWANSLVCMISLCPNLSVPFINYILIICLCRTLSKPRNRGKLMWEYKRCSRSRFPGLAPPGPNDPKALLQSIYFFGRRLSDLC